MAKRRKKSNLNFEESLKKLEKIVRTLEDDQVPLEESLRLFEEGKQLARSCEAELQKAEERVRMLVEGGNGEVGEEDFGEEDSGGESDEDEEEEEPPGRMKRDAESGGGSSAGYQMKESRAILEDVDPTPDFLEENGRRNTPQTEDDLPF